MSRGSVRRRISSGDRHSRASGLLSVTSPFEVGRYFSVLADRDEVDAIERAGFFDACYQFAREACPGLGISAECGTLRTGGRRKRRGTDHNGARGGTRTLTPRRAGGFKPPASAGYATRAGAATVGDESASDGRSGRGRFRASCTKATGAVAGHRATDGGQQRGPDATGRVAGEVVCHEHAFDHVGQHIGGRARPQTDRNHRAAREPADGTRDSGATRRCTEGRDHQPGRARRRANAASELGEPNRGCDIHQPY